VKKQEINEQLESTFFRRRKASADDLVTISKAARAIAAPILGALAISLLAPVIVDRERRQKHAIRVAFLRLWVKTLPNFHSESYLK